jgi:hypothetical protein
MAAAGTSCDIPCDIYGGAVNMKILFRRCAVPLALPGILLLTACSTTPGTQYSSVNYSVYDGYSYPYYAYGGYYYDDDHHHNNDNDDDHDRPDRPDRPNRPDRPIRPDRPSTQPATRPAGGMNRSAGGMGRPSGMSRGGGGRGGGRGGGGRGR